jgi:PBP1b-binding outer membrane lipoprotein LpoB
MKKYILPVMATLLLVSCNKIEEKIDQTVQETKEKVQQKAQQAVEETVKKTVNESINSLTNSEDVKFNTVFPNGADMFQKKKEKNKASHRYRSIYL